MILLLNFMEAPDCVLVCYLCNEAIHEITLIINTYMRWKIIFSYNDVNIVRNHLKVLHAPSCFYTIASEKEGKVRGWMR